MVKLHKQFLDNFAHIFGQETGTETYCISLESWKPNRFWIFCKIGKKSLSNGLEPKRPVSFFSGQSLNSKLCTQTVSTLMQSSVKIEKGDESRFEF